MPEAVLWAFSLGFEQFFRWQAVGNSETAQETFEKSEETHKEEEGCSSSHTRYSKSPSSHRQSGNVSASLKTTREAHAKSSRVAEISGEVHKILGSEITTTQMADALSSLNLSIDENTPKETFKCLVFLRSDGPPSCHR